MLRAVNCEMDDPKTGGTDLTAKDFYEPLMFPNGFAEASSTLGITCHWHELAAVYVTLYHAVLESSQDFSVKRIFQAPQSNAYYLILGLIPREAADVDKPPLFLVRVTSMNQVAVPDKSEVVSLLPLPAFGDQEICNLSTFSTVLGRTPTWEELQRQT